MKKWVACFLVCLLCLLIAAGSFSESEIPKTVSWRGYVMSAVWASTNREDINGVNLRTDGQFVIVRFKPVEGTFEKAVLNVVNEEDEIMLRLASGEMILPSSMMFHNIIQPEGGGFPSVAPEQEDFDMVYFIEGADESSLDGAVFVIVENGEEQTIALDEIPREQE